MLLPHKIFTDNPAAHPHAQGGYSLSLKSQYHHFEKLVNMDYLLPMLFQEEALEYDVIDKIQNEPTRKRKIMCLLDAVQQNGQEGLKQLVVSIEEEKEHMGHKDLACKLKEGMCSKLL